MTGLLFGEHQLAVGEDVQHPAAAQAQLYLFNSGLLFQLAFQAPGLTANVGSNETALDLDSHQSPPHPFDARGSDIVVEKVSGQ